MGREREVEEEEEEERGKGREREGARGGFEEAINKDLETGIPCV